MLPVKVSRTYLTLVAGNVIVAVLPEAGSNVRPAAAESGVQLVPSVEPWTAIVCVRVAHAPGGGSFSTTLRAETIPHRSTVINCGKALLADSQ